MWPIPRLRTVHASAALPVSAARATRAVLELTRAPAALTVPGDSLAGAASAGRPMSRATPLLGASSICLYWAGMALNDVADRHTDARTRPGRPIPSGRISPGVALALAAGLTAAGLVLADAADGDRALAVALPLAATVWAYDLKLKHHPLFGPLSMAGARSLDVLLGAGYGRLRAAAPTAGLLGAHTLVISTLGSRETLGARRGLIKATLTATTAIALTAAQRAPRDNAPSPVPDIQSLCASAVQAGALGLYTVGFGVPQRAAAGRGPRQVQRAVAAGIAAILPLQAACAARSGALPAALCLLGALPLAHRLFREVNPT